jgi:hypothetical protein
VAVWEGFVYVVNGGVSIRHNSTLTVQNTELTVNSYITLNDGAILNLRIIRGTSTARMENFKTYGGVFNIVDSSVTIAVDWDESALCPNRTNTSASPTPSGATVITLPVPITQVSYLTNISIGGVFYPCGHLQIDLKDGDYESPFVPFTYGSIAGRFLKISHFNAGGDDCEKYTITPVYNATRMIITVDKNSDICLQGQTNLYIIIGIVAAALLLAIIIAIVVIACTPAGIPCRIWYRRTCGAKLSSRGNTQGF